MALLDLAVQALIVVLGLALVFSPETLTDGLALAPGQDWLHDLLFAIPLGFLAYTGLETVANLAEEAREPGRTLPRSLFSAIGLVVILTVLVAAVGVSAFPAETGSTELGDRWLEAPLVGIVTAFDEELPGAVVDVLRVVVGLSGALVLLMAVTTSISGCARLAFSMGSHGMLPRELGRLERRTLVSREAIAAIIVVSTAVLILAAALGDETTFLASIYSFGVLLAFTLAQLAVIRLRRRGARPAAPLQGGARHQARRCRRAVAGARRSAAHGGDLRARARDPPRARSSPGLSGSRSGSGVYAATRVRQRRGMLEGVDPRAAPVGSSIRRVLVPMKLGSIGEEMVATAIALAKEHGATVEAITVVAVPREHALDEALPGELAARAEASVAEARALGEENGVEVNAEAVPARSIGHAIVEEAVRREVDLIVLGSSARWRRQSRFFSPTVDHVLKHAPCEVLVVAFPEGVLES